VKQTMTQQRLSTLALFLTLASCAHVTVQRFTPQLLSTTVPQAAHGSTAASVRPARSAVPQTFRKPPQEHTQATVSVLNADESKELALAINSPVRIMNGALIRVDILGPPTGAQVQLRAGDSLVPLTPAGNTQWQAVLRYVDSSNPPNRHPTLAFVITHDGKQTTASFPIVVLHQ
jgi:hypothetical protein